MKRYALAAPTSLFRPLISHTGRQGLYSRVDLIDVPHKELSEEPHDLTRKGVRRHTSQGAE
jgi:hypothetical protein